MIAEKRFKHGDVNLENGLVFWSYARGCKNGERWLTKEKFDQCRRKSRENAKKWYWSDIDASRAKLRKWHNDNKDKKSQSFKNWSEKNKARLRGSSLARKYGLSNEDYISMFESQIGLCAICNEPQQGITKDGETRFLCVDHCHSTGKVRELLCVKCNTGLGQFRDNPEFLIKASKYLVKHQTQGMQQ